MHWGLAMHVRFITSMRLVPLLSWHSENSRQFCLHLSHQWRRCLKAGLFIVSRVHAALHASYVRPVEILRQGAHRESRSSEVASVPVQHYHHWRKRGHTLNVIVRRVLPTDTWRPSHQRAKAPCGLTPRKSTRVGNSWLSCSHGSMIDNQHLSLLGLIA